MTKVYLPRNLQKKRDDTIRAFWLQEKGNLTVKEVQNIFKIDLKTLYRIIGKVRYAKIK